MDSRTEKQQLKQFKDQLKIMLEGPKYSLASWEKEMGDSLSSWRMMVPGAKSQPEVQKMQAFREIIGVMSEHEKTNPSSLLNDVDAQQRLGEAAGHGAEDVKLLLQRFQTLAVYQEWLLKRKVEGKRMPRNMDDMQILAKEDLEKKHKKKVRGRFRRF
jgi:signal recognition particle GTPase